MNKEDKVNVIEAALVAMFKDILGKSRRDVEETPDRPIESIQADMAASLIGEVDHTKSTIASYLTQLLEKDLNQDFNGYKIFKQEPMMEYLAAKKVPLANTIVIVMEPSLPREEMISKIVAGDPVGLVTSNFTDGMEKFTLYCALAEMRRLPHAILIFYPEERIMSVGGFGLISMLHEASTKIDAIANSALLANATNNSRPH